MLSLVEKHLNQLTLGQSSALLQNRAEYFEALDNRDTDGKSQERVPTETPLYLAKLSDARKRISPVSSNELPKIRGSERGEKKTEVLRVINLPPLPFVPLSSAISNQLNSNVGPANTGDKDILELF